MILLLGPFFVFHEKLKYSKDIITLGTNSPDRNSNHVLLALTNTDSYVTQPPLQQMTT